MGSNGGFLVASYAVHGMGVSSIPTSRNIQLVWTAKILKCPGLSLVPHKIQQEGDPLLEGYHDPHKCTD